MEHIELDWLKRWNLYAPENVALKDGETGREFTYADFYRAARTGATVLSRLGVGHGDRIAVLATNEIEYVFLFFAAQRLGAVLVPVNFRLTAREIEHVLADSEAKVLVFQSEFAPVLETIPAASRPRKMLPLNGPGSFAEGLTTAVPADESFAPRADDPCMILYTSGTTGAPKGAVLSHGMLFWNSVNTTMRLNNDQKDAAVIFLPFFHTGAWNVLTTPFFHRGGKIILLRKFDADRVLELCDSEKCTMLFGVPTTMEMMARSPAFAKASLKSLRFAVVGGEPMPIELIRTWHDKGIPVRQGYGLTEFGPNCFSLNEADAIRKIGSIGFPNFYVDAKIVDDNGREVGADEVGELVLRGPACMIGYWRNEKATDETIRNGWLHTGDLARRDFQGYHYIVGRKKDMYKSGGENVYPAELEQVLRQHPGVIEVAVIGVPDEKWGEVGKAFIVHDGAVKEESLREHCLRNLAKFKIPRHFKFMNELPKGDSGKILKRALR